MKKILFLSILLLMASGIRARDDLKTGSGEIKEAMETVKEYSSSFRLGVIDSLNVINNKINKIKNATHTAVENINQHLLNLATDPALKINESIKQPILNAIQELNEINENY